MGLVLNRFVVLTARERLKAKHTTLMNEKLDPLVVKMQFKAISVDFKSKSER